MGKYVKRGLSIIIIVIFTVLFLVYLTNLTQRKSSDYKYRPFFEEKEKFDVFFMGSSHVTYGIYPMELWNEQGITSYNWGGYGSTIPLSYWVMMNVLNYKQPKLIVIDCYLVSANKKTGLQYDNMHQSLDAFPFSKTKYQALQDLWIGNDEVTDKQKWDFLWDFSVYHGRWEGLEKDDFVQESTVEKGAEFRINVCPDPTKDEKYSAEKMKFSEEVPGVIYFRKMIEECQSRGIEVLLIYIPFPADESTHMEANAIEDIAEEYHINYVNFLDMDIVNYKTDCNDVSHLNISGARKITTYLGKYIKEHYEIEDKRGEDAYASWEEDYKAYTEYKTSNIKEQTLLEKYLLLCRDKNVSICLSVKEDSDIYRNKTLLHLIHNLSFKDTLPKLQNAIDSGAEYGLILDNKKGMTWEWIGDETGEANTFFGNVKYSMDALDRRKLFLLENGEDMIPFHTDEKVKPDLQIAVIDNRTGEIIDSSCFIVSNTSERWIEE